MPFRYQCGNIIIRYMTVTFSWASASQRCAAEGGELLSLNNTDAVQCTHDFFASAITESINPSLWSVLAWVNCVQEPCGPGICRTVAFGNSSTPEAVNTSCGAARPAICTIRKHVKQCIARLIYVRHVHIQFLESWEVQLKYLT